MPPKVIHHSRSVSVIVSVYLYLCVQSQHNDHEEEADSPELGYRHHGYSSRVGNEGKARP